MILLYTTLVLAVHTVSHQVVPRPVDSLEAPRQAPADPGVPYVEVRSKDGTLRGQLPALLAAAAAAARASGRTPFVELGATWCDACIALEQSLGTPAMVTAFAGASLIHLDVSEWDVENEMGPLGFTEGGIPAIFAVDTLGRATGPVLRGYLSASIIKPFIQAHCWVSPGHAAPPAQRSARS